MNAIPVDRSDRFPRVPFRQPVRVVPLGGPPRAYRVLAGNLSKGGMFLNTEQPFDEGTRVALSLEASGRVLPFAQGEVVWKRFGDGKPAPGFGVKFTGFLHPRAHDMVSYLVKAIESGEPLTITGAPSQSWKQVVLAGAAALIAGAVVTAGFLAVFGGSGEVEEDVAPAPVVAQAEAAAPAPESAPGSAAPEPAAATDPLAAQVPAAANDRAAAAAPAEAPPPVAEPAAEAERAPPPRTIDLAPMVLTIPQPLPATPSDAHSLALPSGAATRLSWTRAGDSLTLTLTLAPRAKIARAFLLQGPPRLAIDVKGGAPNRSHVVEGPEASLFHRVRVGKTGSATTRLVIDLARAGKKVEERGAQLKVAY